MRKPNRVLIYVLVTLTLCTRLSAVAGDDHQTGNDRPKNILFIAVDDLRPSIGCYGDQCAVTPNIDRLAGRGLQFNRAYCQVAVCNPSRASLMTGLRPDKLGVWTLPIHFREAKPDAVTIPQWFRKFGYTAVSHGKIFHNPTPDPQSWSEPIRELPKLPYAYPDGTKERVAQVDADLAKDDWRKNNLRGPSTAAPNLDDNQVWAIRFVATNTDWWNGEILRPARLQPANCMIIALSIQKPRISSNRLPQVLSMN